MFQQILKYWFLVSVCLLVLLAGCATAPKMVEVTRLVPMSDADTKVTEKGVTIEVTPIDYITVGNYPQLSIRATPITPFLDNDIAPAPLEHLTGVIPM